jgi:hypothetical protein
MITIEELKTYEQTETKLSKVCLEWAKQNLDNSWQRYAGWAFGDHGYIGINYTYNDIDNNAEYETCYGYKLVSWEDMVEFSKTLL